MPARSNRILRVWQFGLLAAVLLAWFLITNQVPENNVTWWQVGHLIKSNFLYLIVWAVIAAAGIVAQLRGPSLGPDQYELDRADYRYG